MDARWQELMPRMLTAYLQWKYPSPPVSPDSPRPEGPAAHTSSDYDLDVDCIDFYSLESTLHVPRASSESPAEALIRNGYLGATPDNPSIAVSLRTLELFQDIRRFKASYSVEAFTKMLCYKYYVRARFILNITVPLLT